MYKFLFIFSIFTYTLIAQQHKSTVEEQTEFYKNFKFTKPEQWDSLHVTINGPIATNLSKTTSTTNCSLTKKVYGWHPYWSASTLHNSYDWNLISDFVYFDYEVSPSTGSNTNASFAWSTSPAVTAALTNSVNIHFCATMFSNHATFWASSSAQQTFITNAITLLNSRGGHGLNIDFEVMAATDKMPFKNFIVDLSTQLKAANPNYKLTVALYAVEWNSVFDIPALVPYVDNFIIMGYDYYYASSPQAGPTAPLYNFETSYDRTLSRSITYYLGLGVPINKLLLGLPYYGREWETTSNTVPSNTTGGFTASRLYSYIKNNPTPYSAANKFWDANSYTPLYKYQSGGTWRQCFSDDEYSMKRKFDMVNQRNLGGIGIWALGYDNGYTEYWDAIRDKFSTCKTVNCTDSIFDMGGPNRNYYNSESYSYTIAPDNASKVKLTFSQFNLEQGFDSLYIYDGNTASSPTLAALSGTVIPSVIQSTGPTLTVRFKSNSTNARSGFKALWQCQNDNTSPTTQITTPTGWITQNFTTTYTDVDNVGGSGVEKSFYQASYFNGTDWRANGDRGFFNDDFNGTIIHPDWTSSVGTWSISSGTLVQTDETNANTNIYAAVTQSLSNRYLYCFKGTISGANTNRRAGIYIACDNPAQTQRGNSYMIWLRPDQSSVEFYKSVANTVGLPTYSANITITPGVTYDYKISYDRINGEIKLWQNNVFIASWIDNSAFVSGTAVSFRSGNSTFKIDDFKIFRSRAASHSILVGATNTNDLRNENPTPANAAGKISSIVKDSANNLSSIVTKTLNIDWSKPITSSLIKDGTSNDVDTTFIDTQLDLNYTAAKDTNSGVSNYYYAIGTTPGAQNITPWTNNNLNLSITKSGLSLINGQKHYTMVKAINGAGLVSDSTVSDGIIYLMATVAEQNLAFNNLVIYPNPASDKAIISIISSVKQNLVYTLLDAQGKLIEEKTLKIVNGLNTLEININQLQLSKGIYFINLVSNKTHVTKKLIIE